MDGKDYTEVTDLLNDIEKRYENQIRANDVPYRHLVSWVNAQDRKTESLRMKLQRKVLLAHKQGPVCNRCDSIFFFDQMTEDHIISKNNGGESLLENLQLFCGHCNKSKGNNSPSEKDVSPFVYQGPPCIHTMTCVELDELQRSWDNRNR